jgi:hypothetical protein
MLHDTETRKPLDGFEVTVTVGPLPGAPAGVVDKLLPPPPGPVVSASPVTYPFFVQ